MIDTLLSTCHKTRSALLALFWFACLSLSGCSEEPLQSYYFSGPTMGTQYNITLVLDVDQSLPLPEVEIQTEIDLWLQDFNQIMSTYIPDSELMRLNRAPLDIPFSLSAPLYEVLSISEQIYTASAGSFDSTVGPLVNLWGFGPTASLVEQPKQSDIDSRLKIIGQHNLKLSGQAATKTSELFIDLSAIAKGYGADVIASNLENLGINNYLIEIGGEIRIKGQSKRRKSWRLGIERPSLLHTNNQQTIEINNGGVATSGDYRNYFEQDGVRYSHTIDPRSGWPVTHNLASITVIADTAAEADAWATALTVAGPEQALVIADKNQLAVFLIIKSETGFIESYNSLFVPYLGANN